MRTPLLFLLLYVGARASGSLGSALQTQTSRTSAGLTAEQCTDMDGPTQSFLTCAGIPSEPDADHILNLKGLISAALDVYSFMRSSVSGVPVWDLSGGFSMNEDFGIRAWLDIKLTPLLSSISRNFLTCLSNRNFSCSTYQTVVKEFSLHFSSLDPVRQTWIYSFFMYPFLSRNSSSGCVDPEGSTEDWLMKNFGSFSIMAQVRDFTSINLLFSGLEVLHLLSPEQKAELLLHPEVMGLTNSSLGLVFQSLLSSLMLPVDPRPSNNSTTIYMHTSSLQDPLGQALNGFMTAFRPVGSFVKQFVSLTQQQSLSSMRSATLVQAMINLTLAEIAAPFKQQQQQVDQVTFNPMNINDWFKHVVSPILRRFLPQDQIEIHPNLTAVFHNQFYIETGMGTGAKNETQDICSVFIDNRTCGLTDLVEHVATVLHCAARSNLTLTEETLSNILLRLSQNLNALLQQLSVTNFSSQSSPFGDVLDQITGDAFPMSNLQDEMFVKLWFQVKLKPLLSTLTPEYLACLSHKEFSCQTFHILISLLGDNMLLMSAEGVQNVYQYFIISFLSRQNVSGGCPAQNSRVWVTLNLGEFSKFATLAEMYRLDRDFNAIDALVVLSPTQTAELIVGNFAGLPEKSVIINTVFNYILISPGDRGLLDMLEHLIVLTGKMGLECPSYQQIVQMLQDSVFPPHMMQPINDDVNQLTQMAPAGCFPPLVTCISTPINETSICGGISSNETLLSAGPVSAPCGIDLQQYACSSPAGLSAGSLADLLTCQLYNSSSSYSKEIWKLLFTKASDVLEGALVIFSTAAADMSQPMRGDVVSQVLDVIWELRVERLRAEQWGNASIISALFSQNLKPFLPFASPSLLQCTISKNLSCQTYQLILPEFRLVSETQGRNMVDVFILPFLSRNATDAGCVSGVNGSTEWLQKNFGSFAPFVSLSDLLSVNGHFNPLETLGYLTPAQTVQLMVEVLHGLPQKEVIISRVFDHLLVSPEERGLPAVLQNLLNVSQTTSIPCSSYVLIFEKLFQALPSLSTKMETLVLHTTGGLKQTGARDCSLPEPPSCLVTPVNVSRVCSGVNSNETLLSAGPVSAPCGIDLQQYACSSPAGLSAGNLADLLTCQLYNSSSSYSKEIWKLLFTKASDVLEGALVIFSTAAADMSQPMRGDVVSQVLDVIWELRVERLRAEQWSNASIISALFSQNLKPFLPFASPSLLQCTISKNLSCQTYQLILPEFRLVSETQGRNMVDVFILPFLSRNATDAGCVSGVNGSTEWLQKNFGSFAPFVSLSDLLSVNGHFNPLETLGYLTPAQTVQLMVEVLPGLPQKEVIISKVFDHLLVSPEERGLPAVLQNLLNFSQTTSIPCSSYVLIFEKLFQALPSLSTKMETLVLHTTGGLKQTGARDCSLPEPPSCLVTPVNVSRVCSGVNSNETLLSAGPVSAPCGIDLQQYACSSPAGLSAGSLADLLTCQLYNSSSSYSKEIWKLLFTKASDVLEGALVIFSTAAADMSQPMRGDVVSQVLDVIWELRVERLRAEQWSNASIISALFSQNLKPFLPFASPSLLQCTISKNLSCQTYQLILPEFRLVSETQGRNMVDVFILPFLSRNATDAGCVSGVNGSTEWLQKNFGSFAPFVSLSDLLSVNGHFNPLETLGYLTPAQTVQLMVEVLHGLPQKEVIISKVFDHLLVSPEERGLPTVLQNLLNVSQTTSIPCSSYVLIFEKLFQALPSLSTKMETLVLHTTGGLKQTGARDCSLPEPPSCLVTPVNVSRVCSGVNSNETLLSAGPVSAPCGIDLQQYACSSLAGLSAGSLADLLTCQLYNSSSSYSKEIWKLLFTKASDVLEGALVIFSTAAADMSQPMRGDVVSQVLDVIWELRVERLRAEQWSNASIISALFSQNLKPFLPFASPSLLQCTISKNLSCQTYQLILPEFRLVSETQGRNMVDVFILPFLSRNATDAGCVSGVNGSTEWLQKNFGSFAPFVSLSDLLSVNGHFNPLETLGYLTPAQTVQLMVEVLPGLPQKEVIISKVFDHLLVSPEERGLPTVLQNLLNVSQTTSIPCSSYVLIFEKLFQALPSLSTKMETLVLHTTGGLKQTGARDCSLPEPPSCLVTPVNVSRVCSGVNSNETLLSAGPVSAPCGIDLQQYACSSLAGLSAGSLADLLTCQLYNSSSSYSKEIWKLLFTKASDVLEGALVIFSTAAADMSQPMRGDVVSQVLDVIWELRVERLRAEQWSNASVISALFSQNLKPFLPFASPSLLQCTISKNLSCQTYQLILPEFRLVSETQGRNMVDFFILPFLSRNATDAGCVSGVNGSTEWLQKNFGSFAPFVSLSDLLSVNGHFNPLETLGYLTPAQTVQLMVEVLPGLPQKEVIISKVFDHLLVSPEERGLPAVLQNLLNFSQTTSIPCSSYVLIFEKLFQALPSLSTKMETLVLHTTGGLKQTGARDCSLPEPPSCLVTPVNVSRVCSGVNSNETLLSAGPVSAPCGIDLQQYACSSLAGLSAGSLADLLTCQLYNSSSSYSKEIWKLLFTKASDVLEGALVIFSTAAADMSQPMRGDVVSQVLDVIWELRVERLRAEQWSNASIISALFSQNLKPFLPFASPSLLQCTISKNLSCQTYQLILPEFRLVSETQGRNMVDVFILPFLSRNATDAGCVSGVNGSTEWLQKNFGSFAPFVSLSDLLSVNGHFNPLETLGYLTPAQTVQLMVEVLHGLPQKEVIISKVFDHLLVSPEERGLPTVLQNLLNVSQTTSIPCSSYVLIFEKLFQALPSLSTKMETLVLHTTGGLKQTGARDCSLPEPPSCLVTPVNVSRVCSGVNSNETLLSAGPVSAPCGIDLQQYACSSLAGLSAGSLADLLTCQLYNSSSSYSKEIWKLLFTKASDVLEGALVIFSTAAADMSQPMRGDVVSQVLDVIWELRVERLRAEQWSNASIISALFSQNLKPFLPFASPSLLQCTISKNLSCQTYQLILPEFRLVSETQGRNMVDVFILPFLSRNATDAGCVSGVNGSTEWLQKNFGSFAPFVSLSDLLSVNGHFNPLETLGYLTPAQTVQLMVEVLPGLPQKEVIISKVFDHLLVSPEERGLPTVLQNLLNVSQTTSIPCSSYVLIFEKLFQALPSLSTKMETLVLHTTGGLKQTGARDCSLPEPPSCLVTPVNVSRVCSGVNSNETLLSAGPVSAPCGIDLQQYACSSPAGLSAGNLADLLTCQLYNSSSSYSKEIWKLLFTKASDVLEGALVIFSTAAADMSQPMRGDVVSQVLDVIWELRVERLRAEQWSNASIISALFSQNLKPFLPFASPSLLQCTISKNLSCQTYQLILPEFRLVSETQGRNMVDVFILPFLSRNATDAGCVSGVNGSTEWLQKNFGSFAPFVSLSDLLSVNGHFNPLETLGYLTPAQTVQLMVEVLPGLPQKEVIISKVFDHLLVSPEERGLPAVLQNLLNFSQTTSIPCSSYVLIFEKLFQALPSLSTKMETLVLHTTGGLKQTGARDCSLPEPPSCLVTPVNVSRVCSGVNSNETLLSAGPVSAPCGIDLQQYACSSLAGLSAGSLADLLTCQLYNSSSSYSKEIWKLLFTKASDVLEGALVIFSTAAADMSQPMRGDVVSQVLDVIWELRVERLRAEQWSNASIISALFSQNLKPFLPFASPSLLQCTISKNLSCQTYQLILPEFRLVSETQGRNMVDVFILPFLSRNATDAGCVSGVNGSTEWLQKNFGSFAPFVSLSDLLSVNGHFNPLETLGYLTPAQTVQLMVEVLHGLPQKEVIISKVFDHLLVSPEERGLPTVLQNLLNVSQTTSIPCSSYVLIFEKLFQALPSLSTKMETLVLHTTGGLKQTGARDCSLPEPPSCLVTPVNVSRVCSGVNSNETLLSAGPVSAPCGIDLQQYACSSLAGLSAGSLADLLTCQLYNSSSSYSKEIWKLLFTKASDVLEGALVIFSTAAADMSQPMRGDVVSQVLDVIWELRVERLRAEQWSNASIISALFSQNLKPFLPFASPSLLQCTISKNLSCQTYQLILPEFRLVSETQGRNMVDVFILPFLSRNATDAGCVSGVNGSTEWLQKNFGSFAPFVSLSDLLSVNGHFNPLETLGYLTPAQMVQLMVEVLPGLPQKEVIISKVFDHLLVSPEERGLPTVLQNLLNVSQTTSIPCSSYVLIFEKLFQALPSLSTKMETLVLHTTGGLKQTGARDCSLPEPPSCLVTPVNVSRVCSGVNSNETLLSAGPVSAPCGIDLQQYACSSLAGLSAGNLADLLTCQLYNSSSSYSKEIWKLLFTKASDVLEGALVIFSTAAADMSQPMRGDVVSQVLDVIWELRVERLRAEQWSNASIISALFSQNLKPFLPFASPSLLQCTISKNLSCQTYQLILPEFRLVSETQGRNMVDVFILPFLSRNATDAGCVSGVNGSTEWLQKNFGSFAPFVSLSDLLSVNGHFNPLETLGYLTPAQTVQLMVEVLPGLPQKEVIISKVFDHLLVSPEERGLPTVLALIPVFSAKSPLSCPASQLIFERLDQILRSGAGGLEPVIWRSMNELSSAAPAGCTLFPVVNECPVTPFNESLVCGAVDSSALQQYLNNGNSTPRLCDFTIAQYACTTVLNVSVDQLVSVLFCHLSDEVVSSPDSWKLLLTRVSYHLDVALQILADMSPWWSSSSASVALDVLRELRLDRLTDVVGLFSGNLRPFLPSASSTFLQCLRSKNFSCQSFQTGVGAFSAGFPHMHELQRQITVTEFILPLLSRQTPGAACASDDSSQWLVDNFGHFSSLVSVKQMISLNPQFKPLGVLLHLSPEQLVELMLADVPGLPEKSVVIGAVFDQLANPLQKDRVVSTLTFMAESSKTMNVSCPSYQIIFHRLDHLMVSASVDLETVILRSKSALLQHVPEGCVSSSGQCGVTPVNETTVCRNVNSSVLSAYLGSSHDGRGLCEFSMTQYACAELTVLSSQDLATVLSCSLNGNESVSDETWKLFIQKVNPVLGPALDLLADTRLNRSHSLESFLSMIGEVTLSSFSSTNLRDDSFVRSWFDSRLRPFLPYASERFLSCLSTRNFSCDTFRIVVGSFSQSFDLMSTNTQTSVCLDFIQLFLQNNSAGCVNVSQSSSDWLISSFGRFSMFTTVTDLQKLNPSFNVLDALNLLSVKQLAEVSVIPGLLSSPAAVDNLLLYVPDAQFTTFYTSLGGALQVPQVALPPPVQEAFLQQVFDRANLTTLSDDDMTSWIVNILPPFIVNITVQQVTSYFSITQQRPCPISQQAVKLLNSSSATFQPATQHQIYQLILGSLTGPAPLRCYSNQSFYTFLTSSFMSFQFPSLTTFLSMMPPGRVPELLDSISPSEVSSLLNRPDAVDDVTQICQLFTKYPKTPQYLQTEPLLSGGLAQELLSCVWPQVLKVEKQSEVNQWFDYRLVRYLPLLTSELIGPDVMQRSSCLSFRKFVSVMAKYNYSTGFTPSNIYDTIMVYLNTSSSPKCYNSSVPELNSTAWFQNYISVFVEFITLEDFQHFGSTELQPFFQNLENIKLFGEINVPDDVMEYYVTQLFDTNPTFSAYYLPQKFLCLAPASSFIDLSQEQLKNVSSVVHQYCDDIQLDVSAALASNPEVLTVESIELLGQSCIGLSTTQISEAGGNVLLNGLSVLRGVTGWNLDQAMIIIQTLLVSGVYQLNSVVSLESLGSLIIGVQSSIINVISGDVLLQAVKSESFVTNIISAPVIVQQTIVNQIITVNSSSDAVITNIPDSMATQIPRSFLLDVTSTSAQMVNQKKWKHEQAVLIFESVAMQFNNPDDMSFQVLQGFTSSRIQSFSTSKVMSLIRGCKRRGNKTLILQESQLTCMYQYIKSSDVNSFSQYPAEVLIYYNYSMIDRSLCRSYFSSLGTANFSVLSSTLSFKKQTLFNNAKDCLGITQRITQSQLDVLGNMCCFLSPEFIQNSHPYVLEKLKQCSDLTAEQVTAVESVLLGGNTTYGSFGRWNRTTLENLDTLLLYVTVNIWSKFTPTDKQKFLKTFIYGLRKNNKASEMKILNMMNEVSKVSRVRIKRSGETVCTAGQIMQAQVYSNMFPFAYDLLQFNACLINETLKSNLEAITERVYDRSYQRIILDKLQQQVYLAGLPDEVLQVLGSTSRSATANDVALWNLTKIDSLTALMNPLYGDWDPNMVRLLVSKYLSVNGNTLGTNELNALGGNNLCALNTSVLNNITAGGLQQASALSLTNCSSEKKSVLFSIAQNAFSTTKTRSTDTVSIPTYQLLQNYLGGADSAFIRRLVNSSVNMDVPTFMSLEQSVINVLNVTDVRSLLGVNVGDLKTYEGVLKIQEWIKLQPQTDLDSLQINLTGGRNSSTTSNATTAANTSSTTSANTGSSTAATSGTSTATGSTTTTTTTRPLSASATTAAGSRVLPPVCLQLLLLLAVTMMTPRLLR